MQVFAQSYLPIYLLFLMFYSSSLYLKKYQTDYYFDCSQVNTSPLNIKSKILSPLSVVNFTEAAQPVKRNSTESPSSHSHDLCQITQDLLYLGRKPLLFTNTRATSYMQARW